MTAQSSTDSTGTHTASYGYDQDGDTVSRPDGSGGTQALTWDAQGRLSAVADAAQPTSYVYDVSGNRLISRDATGSTLYLPDQELRYTAGTGAKATTRYYSEAGQTVAVRTTAGLTWLVADSHGTASVAIASVGQAVAVRRQDPYGNARGTTGTWPAGMNHGFVGGTADPTGLVHLGAREYDPGSGRFISVDPQTDTKDPQRLDGYAYSNDNPITFTDPSGKRFYDPTEDDTPAPVVNRGSGGSITTVEYGGSTFKISSACDTQAETNVYDYLNKDLADAGQYSDGTNNGSGYQYLAVKQSGSTMPDMIRVQWVDGKPVSVTRVDIYSPGSKTGGDSIFNTLDGKAAKGQAEEVVVDLEGRDSDGELDAVKNIGGSLTDTDLTKLNTVRVVTNVQSEDGSTFQEPGMDVTITHGTGAASPLPWGGNSTTVTGDSVSENPAQGIAAAEAQELTALEQEEMASEEAQIEAEMEAELPAILAEEEAMDDE
jgi:RHS repeat-associated protein